MMNQERTVEKIKDNLERTDFVIRKATTDIFDLVNFIGYLNGKSDSAIINTMGILKESNVTLEDVINNTLDFLKKQDSSK